MLNFAYYQMALVNVGQKGKVSTQKSIVTYFATLSSTEAGESDKKEGRMCSARKELHLSIKIGQREMVLRLGLKKNFFFKFNNQLHRCRRTHNCRILHQILFQKSVS
jgi:hypothetical protein